MLQYGAMKMQENVAAVDGGKERERKRQRDVGRERSHREGVWEKIRG